MPGKLATVLEKIDHGPHVLRACGKNAVLRRYLKLFEKLYAPLTAGILQPFAGDDSLPSQRTSPLDRRYQAVVQALDNLVEAVGLKIA